MAETEPEPDSLAMPDGVLEMRTRDFSSRFILLFLSERTEWDDDSEADDSLMGPRRVMTGVLHY